VVVDSGADVVTVTTEADMAGIVTTEVDTDGTVTTDEEVAVDSEVVVAEVHATTAIRTDTWQGIAPTVTDVEGAVAAVEADATPSATTATAQVTLPGTAPRATGDAGTDCTSARNHNYSSHHNIILNNNLSKSFFSHFKVLSPQQIHNHWFCFQ